MKVLAPGDPIRRPGGRRKAVLLRAVSSGMRSLKRDGMEKVLMGVTDLKQVRSVCIK